jgi:hypothetical protein
MKFPQHLEYLKSSEITWFNPCYGFHGFWEAIKKFQKEKGLGFDDAWKNREMKKAKEIYATAIAAMAMQQSEGNTRPWWFTKPTQDPPDGIIGTVSDNGIGNVMSAREVEVVEHLHGDLVETIERKLERKNYETNTILVCLVSQLGVYDYEKMHETIVAKRLSLAHIFFAGRGGRLPGSNLTNEQILAIATKVTVVQVSPIFASIEMDPWARCLKWSKGEEGNFLKFDRRGKGVGFRKITSDNPPKLF